MQARGFPVGEDFDRRCDDLSVEYPHVLENYRRARSVTVARREGRDVSTEDMRAAMVCYRDLFRELVGSGKPSLKDATAKRSA
jgi:hypothetical protein